MDPFPENPYAAPQAFDALKNGPADDEAIRGEYLKVEAAIKSLGLLHYLTGFLTLRLGISFIGQHDGDKGITGWVEPAIGVLLLVIAICFIITAAAVRRFKPWARIGAGVLCCVGLLAFPMGTLLNPCFLYLIFGKKTKTVFSEPYRTIIANTPHIKPEISIFTWILLGFVVLFLAIAFFNPLTSR